MSRRRAADVAAAAALVALAFALYHRAAGFWWAHDDFFHLAYVAEHPPTAYALDPEVWRRLPFRMLTPLLMLSLDADLTLFGPRPGVFHLRQVAALGAAAAAVYALLRAWLRPAWSAAGGALFLAGPPVASLAALLMARHYVDGLLLAVASALAWVAALRRGSRGWAAASAALWLAAALAKEVFVPLVALLPLVPGGRPRDRWRLALPHAVALALYAAYRLYLLDTLVGGYGSAVPPGKEAQALAGLPLSLARTLAGGGTAGWLALVLALVAALAFLWRERRATPLLAGGAVAVLLPLLPLAGEVAPRHATVAWTALAFAATVAAARWARSGAGGGRPPRSTAAGRWLAPVGFAVLLVAALAANRVAWAQTVEEQRRLAAENRFALAMGPDDLLDHPAELPAALDAMPVFALRVHGRRLEPVGRFADDLFLCRGGAEGKRAWRWQGEGGRMVAVGAAELAARRRRACAALRGDAPLSVRLVPSEPVLWWRLGPYEEGDYRILLDDGVRAIPVPAEGGYWLQRRGPFRLRVRYGSPAGWTTYSPELVVELGSGRPVEWRRGAAEEGG
ncbi:MAG TPA: hypothetical protein VHM02_13565 [Thermoanaerobaculia bacterium]|nr:hypothetical protein [Thermoanaerobaculia bacterium]